jgi:inner membrane protein
MPSPIAHSVTGYVLFKLFRLKFPPVRASWLPLAGAIVVANAADLDFVAQLLLNTNLHRGVTHSVGFALGASILVTVLGYRAMRSQTNQLFVLTGMIYSSHLLLDFFTAGGRGLQLFWPLTSAFFQSPIPLFPAVQYSEGLFYWGHLLFITWELLYAGLLIKGVQWATSKPLKSRHVAELDS